MPIRDDILQAAATAFSERGYATATLDDVARLVGIRKPSLYHHIRSKEELLVQIQDVLMRELWEATKTAVAEASNASEKITAIIRVYMKMNAEHPAEARVVAREFRALSGEGRERILQHRRAYLAFVEEIIERGIAQKEFRNQSARLSALAILGILNSAQDWYSPEGPLTADQVTESFAALVTDGLNIANTTAAGNP